MYSFIVFLWIMCFNCTVEGSSFCFVHFLLFSLEWGKCGCIVAYGPLGPAGGLLFDDAG